MNILRDVSAVLALITSFQLCSSPHQKLLSWCPACSRHPKILVLVLLLGVNIPVLE